MTSCTCPNNKCTNDKQLQPGQNCPLCGKLAKEFKFSELENLWKQKWDFKKSIERIKKQEITSRSRAFCPRCGSTNINFSVFYRPSIWRCLDCGYEGTFIVEDSKLAEKIQKHCQKTREGKQK
jgi:DNA-directed RNA polymerase subunit M